MAGARGCQAFVGSREELVWSISLGAAGASLAETLEETPAETLGELWSDQRCNERSNERLHQRSD